MTALSIVLAVAGLPFVAGRWHRAAPPLARPGRLSEVERRLSELERTAGPTTPGSAGPPAGHPRGTTTLGSVGLDRLDKDSTVSHYEALADQVAYERQLAGPAWCTPPGQGVALRLVWSGGGAGLMDGHRG